MASSSERDWTIVSQSMHLVHTAVNQVHEQMRCREACFRVPEHEDKRKWLMDALLDLQWKTAHMIVFVRGADNENMTDTVNEAMSSQVAIATTCHVEPMGTSAEVVVDPSAGAAVDTSAQVAIATTCHMGTSAEVVVDPSDAADDTSDTLWTRRLQPSDTSDTFHESQEASIATSATMHGNDAGGAAWLWLEDAP